jgi:hypothetical protein
VKRRFSAIAALAIGICVVHDARAGEGDASITEQLFLEGKALMKDGQYAKACEKLQASYDRDQTATGTLANLALCHEALGKTATAWAEFRRVAAESAVKRPDRVAFARSHEAALAPSLSYLRVGIAPGARVAGLVVSLDKRPIDPGTWDSELPIDPGKHEIEASAKGKRPRTSEVTIAGPASHESFVVQPLADAPPEPKVAPPEAGPVDNSAARTRRLLGYVMGGAGVAAIGVGAAFGLTASSKDDDVRQLCPSDQCPNNGKKAEADDALSAAHRAATVSNVLVGAGALLFVTGGIFVLTSFSGGRPAPKAARVAPTIAPTSGGAALVFSGDLW